MTDVFTVTKRREIMKSIRGKDTIPEMVVRRLTHGLGYRYRLHQRSLPGCPDLVFSARRKVIFVNGCFWHRHRCRKGQSTPSTRQAFWEKKFRGNKERDLRNRRRLRRLGWAVLTIWECQTTSQRREALADKIIAFLDAGE